MTLESYLNSVRERARHAVDGPWNHTNRGQSIHGPKLLVCSFTPETEDEEDASDANFDFIAAARTDVPKLLRIIEAYRKYIDCLSTADLHDLSHKIDAILEDV